jgi:hypothetical protein
VWVVSSGISGSTMTGEETVAVPTSVVAHSEPVDSSAGAARPVAPLATQGPPLPSWVRDFHERVGRPTLEHSRCVQIDDGVACVAVSPYQSEREQALDRAREKSAFALMRYLDMQISSEEFNRGSRAAYQQVVWSMSLAKLSIKKKSGPQVERRALHALAAATRQEAAEMTPDTFWQEFAGADGRSEFKAYARIVVDKAMQDTLVSIYTREHEWGGTTVMTAFPLIALSHQDFEGGVIVTGKATDRLPRLSVITEIGGKPIRRAEDLEGFSPDDGIVLATPNDSPAAKCDPRDPLCGL